jgi:hypothetical protein
LFDLVRISQSGTVMLTVPLNVMAPASVSFRARIQIGPLSTPTAVTGGGTCERWVVDRDDDDCLIIVKAVHLGVSLCGIIDPGVVAMQQFQGTRVGTRVRRCLSLTPLEVDDASIDYEP